jgi:predicted regulator of Ras-like GTPase activity (Roadblock/LC7/MglB family)
VTGPGGGFAVVLDGLTRVAGVRSALVVSAEDGLVVAETSMEGVDAGAAAALAGSLATRLARVAAAAGAGGVRIAHLEAATGGVVVVPVVGGLLLVTVVEPEANLGLLRLALRDSADRLA